MMIKKQNLNLRIIINNNERTNERIVEIISSDSFVRLYILQARDGEDRYWKARDLK